MDPARQPASLPPGLPSTVAVEDEDQGNAAGAAFRGGITRAFLVIPSTDQSTTVGGSACPFAEAASIAPAHIAPAKQATKAAARAVVRGLRIGGSRDRVATTIPEKAEVFR